MNSKTDIITLSTQPYTKSSCQLNTAHFQPVNSTLVFSKAAPLQNEKIREPEEHLQLSEILYFQAFFGIQFCTFVNSATVSTCNDPSGLMSFTLSVVGNTSKTLFALSVGGNISTYIITTFSKL